MGLSTTGYLFGNLLYCYLFTILTISPVFAMCMYYHSAWSMATYFIAYILCSNCFLLMMISFFKDSKLCSEVIALFCGLSSILYYLVDLQKLNTLGYIALMLPQPGFAVAVLKDSKKALSMMLISTKIFIVIFGYRQFNINPF